MRSDGLRLGRVDTPFLPILEDMPSSPSPPSSLTPFSFFSITTLRRCDIRVAHAVNETTCPQQSATRGEEREERCDDSVQSAGNWNGPPVSDGVTLGPRLGCSPEPLSCPPCPSLHWSQLSPVPSQSLPFPLCPVAMSLPLCVLPYAPTISPCTLPSPLQHSFSAFSFSTPLLLLSTFTSVDHRHHSYRSVDPFVPLFPCALPLCALTVDFSPFALS